MTNFQEIPSKVEAYIKLIPGVTIAVYILGYIILNLHLNKYLIFESEILSFEYIEVGLLFLIFQAPLIVIVAATYYLGKKHSIIILDPNKNVLPIWFYTSVLVPIASIVVYGIFLQLITPLGLKYKLVSWTFIGTTLLGFIVSAVSFYLYYKFKYKIILFFTSAFLYLILFFGFQYYMLADSNYIFVLLSAFIVSSCSLIPFKDWVKGEIKLSYLSMAIVPLFFFFSIPTFAWFIYRLLPQAVGGGKSYEKYIIIEKNEKLSKPDSILINSLRNKNLEILYENKINYYIKNDNKTICLNKKNVIGEYQTKPNEIVQVNKEAFRIAFPIIKKIYPALDSLQMDSIIQTLNK